MRRFESTLPSFPSHDLPLLPSSLDEPPVGLATEAVLKVALTEAYAAGLAVFTADTARSTSAVESRVAALVAALDFSAEIVAEKVTWACKWWPRRCTSVTAELDTEQPALQVPDDA